MAHVGLSRASEAHRMRIGREQQLPDFSNHSLYLMKLLNQLSWGTLRNEPAVRWFGWSSALHPGTTNDWLVSGATSLHQSSLLTLHFPGSSSPSFKSRHVCLIQTTCKITLEWKSGVCVKVCCLCVCLLCVAAHQRMCVYPQHMCKCEVTVCVSELRTHKKSNCFLAVISTDKYIHMSVSHFN